MKAIKKTDENLVKVALDICHIFPFKSFYSKDDFMVNNHSIMIYTKSNMISSCILRCIPSNFSFGVCYFNDNTFGLCIWYETR